MNILKTPISFFLILFSTTISAQTDGIINITPQPADDIIKKYFKHTGGNATWQNIHGIKMELNLGFDGMEIPMETYQTKGGKLLIKFTFQGKEITQQAFDGETLWLTNLSTMQAELGDSEATANIKNQSKDFPSPFFNYKKKEFSVEYMGKETIEGVLAHKIKLEKTPIISEGIEVPNISYNYFDTETYYLIATKTEIPSGTDDGQWAVNTMGDYRNVNGLYFPFKLNIAGQSIVVTKIELNPAIDDAMFKFPGADTNKN